MREALAELKRHLKRDYKFIGLSHDADDSDDSLASESPHQSHIAYFASVGSDETEADLDLPALARTDVTLEQHTEDITSIARKLTHELNLTPDLAGAVVLACIWHDTGKKNPQWQKAIDNRGEAPLAKSKRSWFDHFCTQGYRHEFGSLIEARDDENLKLHPQRRSFKFEDDRFGRLQT